MLLCLLIGFLDGFDLASMGLAVPLIARDWGVEPGVFGTALAAVMVGIAVGNIGLGWLGDRFGRRPLLIFSSLAMGFFSLATMSATDVAAITLWRFLLGVAFGAGIPNTYAMIADVVPAGRRMLCMTIFTASTSIGAIAGGLIAPALSRHFGWEGIFLAGGAVPLAIGMALIVLLPESPQILAAQGRMADLQKVLASFRVDSDHLPPSGGGRQAAAKLRPSRLMQGGYLLVTLCYVVGWSCSGFTYYILANWLPTLLTSSGWDIGASQRSITYLFAGSMAGGLALSWLADRWPAALRLPAIAYAAGVLLFVGAAFALRSPLLPVLLVGLGLTVGGAQYLLPALIARVYPTDLLATALGWLGALSRIGAIVGPAVGGWMLLSDWTPRQILLASGLGPLVAALAFALLIHAARATQANHPPPG